MSLHMKMLEENSKKTFDDLRPLAQTKLENGALFLVVEEKILVNGTKRAIHRILIEGDEFPNYIVGWLLECEIDQCLVCTKSFEENGLKKLRCWACGNITCENCCPFEAEITEIISVGEKPVCVQCCWGQVRIRYAKTCRRFNSCVCAVNFCCMGCHHKITDIVLYQLVKESKPDVLPMGDDVPLVADDTDDVDVDAFTRESFAADDLEFTRESIMDAISKPIRNSSQSSITVIEAIAETEENDDPVKEPPRRLSTKKKSKYEEMIEEKQKQEEAERQKKASSKQRKGSSGKGDSLWLQKREEAQTVTAPVVVASGETEPSVTTDEDDFITDRETLCDFTRETVADFTIAVDMIPLPQQDTIPQPHCDHIPTPRDDALTKIDSKSTEDPIWQQSNTASNSSATSTPKANKLQSFLSQSNSFYKSPSEQPSSPQVTATTPREEVKPTRKLSKFEMFVTSQKSPSTIPREGSTSAVAPVTINNTTPSPVASANALSSTSQSPTTPPAIASSTTATSTEENKTTPTRKPSKFEMFVNSSQKTPPPAVPVISNAAVANKTNVNSTIAVSPNLSANPAPVASPNANTTAAKTTSTTTTIRTPPTRQPSKYELFLNSSQKVSDPAAPTSPKPEASPPPMPVQADSAASGSLAGSTSPTRTASKFDMFIKSTPPTQTAPVVTDVPVPDNDKNSLEKPTEVAEGQRKQSKYEMLINSKDKERKSQVSIDFSDVNNTVSQESTENTTTAVVAESKSVPTSNGLAKSSSKSVRQKDSAKSSKSVPAVEIVPPQRQDDDEDDDEEFLSRQSFFVSDERSSSIGDRESALMLERESLAQLNAEMTSTAISEEDKANRMNSFVQEAKSSGKTVVTTPKSPPTLERKSSTKFEMFVSTTSTPSSPPVTSPITSKKSPKPNRLQEFLSSTKS